MEFWETVLSGLVAAVVAGIILRQIYNKKKQTHLNNDIGNIKTKEVELEGTGIESNVQMSKNASGSDAGNIDLNKTNVSKSNIKSNVKFDE